jgi:hypothetical protein
MKLSWSGATQTDGTGVQEVNKDTAGHKGEIELLAWLLAFDILLVLEI